MAPGRQSTRWNSSAYSAWWASVLVATTGSLPRLILKAVKALLLTRCWEHTRSVRATHTSLRRGSTRWDRAAFSIRYWGVHTVGQGDVCDPRGDVHAMVQGNDHGVVPAARVQGQAAHDPKEEVHAMGQGSVHDPVAGGRAKGQGEVHDPQEDVHAMGQGSVRDLELKIRTKGQGEVDDPQGEVHEVDQGSVHDLVPEAHGSC